MVSVKAAMGLEDCAVIHNNKNPDEEYHAFLCHGAGRGCKRNSFRKSKITCDDCIGPIDKFDSVQQMKDALAAATQTEEGI